MAGHHLVLGTLRDFITGEELADTHDERYRQRIARLLVEERSFQPDEIEMRRKLHLQAGNRKAVIPIDFLVHLSGRIMMLIQYGPGSLVTRRRPVLSASRLVAPYLVPVAVVTNGEDAEILDSISGKLLGAGLQAIPEKATLLTRFTDPLPPVSPERARMESRIMYAYTVDDSCPCDETICRVEEQIHEK